MYFLYQTELLAEQYENIIAGLDLPSALVLSCLTAQRLAAAVWLWQCVAREARKVLTTGSEGTWNSRLAFLGADGSGRRKMLCLEEGWEAVWRNMATTFCFRHKGISVQGWMCWLLYRESLPTVWGSNRVTAIFGQIKREKDLWEIFVEVDITYNEYFKQQYYNLFALELYFWFHQLVLLENKRCCCFGQQTHTWPLELGH